MRYSKYARLKVVRRYCYLGMSVSLLNNSKWESDFCGLAGVRLAEPNANAWRIIYLA